MSLPQTNFRDPKLTDDVVVYANVETKSSYEPETIVGSHNAQTYANAEFVELAAANAGEPRQKQEDFPVISLAMSDNKGKTKQKMLYEIEDIPSWYITLFLAFQHYLLMAGATLSLPLFLMPKMCMKENDPEMGKLLSTYIFVSGIITILQTTFGVRLPIVQGGSFAYLLPAVAILSSERWKCPTGATDDSEVWKERIRELQGAIIVASLFQIALGFFGVFGLIMSAITPITLATSIIIIGLSLFEEAAKSAAKSWLLSIPTIVLVIMLSQYLREIKIPIPFTRSKTGEGLLRYPMFQIFPILLTIIFAWTLSAILIETKAISANQDWKIDIVNNAPWFIIPFPFQWGRPTFTTGAAIGFLSAVIAGVVESLGEYRALARIVHAPKPPVHSINRGVFIEGIGCLLTGIFGTGSGTTSYSGNTGAISITKVGSRRVVQTAGLLMIIFSLIGKLGAFFVSVPQPIIGGILCVTFSMIIAVGISYLHNVDLTSARNMFIIGFSIFFSMAVSKWAEKNEKEINFGHPDINFTIHILLRTGMFIAAVSSILLDNTIPGTLEERGLAGNPNEEKYGEGEMDFFEQEEGESTNVTYDLPFGMRFLRRYEFTAWIPISPTFKPSKYSELMNTFYTKCSFSFNKSQTS